MVQAQEIGVVTPFYTRINFTIPGYVPYNWEYTDDGVAINGVASDVTIAEIPANIKDLRIKPKDGVEQPKAFITSIGDNAFANNTNITDIIFLDELKDGEIKEKTKVATIGDSAFSGCSNLTFISNFSNVSYIGDSAFNGCSSLTSISDLSNVTYIGNNAFYDCKELTSVSLPNLSSLGDNAFAECSKLTEVSFDTNSVLETIRQRTFYNTGLSNFTIPVNVTNIEDEAFLGTAITSIEGNANYVWQDNVLIKYNVSDTAKKIAVYVNPTLSSISFPNTVAILNSKLFKNNANINEVYLNEVEYIGPEAFRNSSLTNIHNSNKIIDCDKTALLDTPWYNNSSDFIILGKVLLEYKGTESIVKIPDNVYRIGANCFNNNFTTQVVLSEQIDSLGYTSLSSLTSLKSIIFTSDLPPILDGSCFNDDVILYVKESRLDEYKKNISFINLPNDITKKEIQINFYDINNSFIDSKTEYYGSKFDNFVSAPTIKGKDFCGWRNNAYELKINDMIEYYENLELTAYYETAQYQISINGADGNQNLTIAYGQQISLPIPSEKGKTFMGWFDQNEGGNLIVDTTGQCIWDRTIDNDILYLQFENISYKITYEKNDSDIPMDMPNDFTVDNPVTKAELSSPQKFGYVFKSWQYNNQAFTSTSGIFDDIVLVATWEGTIIKFANNSTITDSVAIVDMTSTSTSDICNITIASSVKSIIFVGKENTTYRLTINISERDKAIILGFKNMSFKASGSSENAITCNSDVMIYLTYFGYNIIEGGDGANATGYGNNGGNGGYGISAYSITLMAFDSTSKINVFGGNGGNGSNGAKGNNGKDGTKAPSGSIFKPVKGENGSDGDDGQNGGNGGDGGYGIYASSKKIFLTPNSIYKIKGGNGGDGGDGGAGGSGGDGADDTSANPFTGAGDPGDGGDGGDGGANGEAGQGSFGSNVEHIKSSSGSKGEDGKIGKGGAAGSGGDHGTLGGDGGDGARGEGGSDGLLVTNPPKNVGHPGGGAPVIEDLVELPYAFSDEFLSMYL